MIKTYLFIQLLVLTVILRASADMQALVDAPRISDIKFYGIYPFFSTELLDRMSVYPGSVCDSVKTDQQKEHLTEYLKSKGYDSVRVFTEVEEEPENLRLLKIRIDKSGYFTIGDITVSGNHNISGLRLKKEMKTWWRSFVYREPGRFIPDELENDIVKLSSFYKDRGYSDAEIKYEIRKDSLKRTADIVLTVIEGPEYEINISGNEFFSGGALSEQTDLIKEGRRGSVALRQAVRGIRKMYREEGFGDAKVKMKDTLVTEDGSLIKKVSLEISEGIRPLVSEINFKGNDSFSSDELGKYLNSVVRRWWRSKEYFRKDAWDDDERNLRAFYNQSGFLSAKVRMELKYSRGRDSVRISAEINEGIRTVIDSVSCTGLPEEFTPDIEKITSELKGKPYNQTMAKDAVPRIKGLLAAGGYIYAEVKEKTTFSPDSSKADIVFTADVKNMAETGKIYVAGNLKTKERTVRKLLKIKEGEPFLLLGLSEGLKNLRNQKIFRSVSSFTSDTEGNADTLDILVSVEEYPPYYFQASGGYESFTGPYISLLAGNRNLFGRNKELSLKTDLSFVKQSVTAAFTEPVLFVPELSGTLSAFWEREDVPDPEYQTETTGFGAGANYRWKSSLQSIVQAQIEHKKLYEESVSGADSNTVRNSGSLKFIQLWDGRDSFMVPRRGIYANLETEFSTGIDNNEDDFIKYKLDFKYFFTPFGPVTFAFSGRLNYLQMTNPSAEPSVDQLFYLGGTSSIRGMNENAFLEDTAGEPLGGKLTGLFTFEPRFEFRKNWELPFFIDTGLLSETAEGGKETVRSTAGTGMRYITPIGAIGILWGFPLDIKDGWKDGVFHFSIGYTF